MAIHTAGMLAFSENGCVNSASIAMSIDTNPVVVRRMIGVLVSNGLVKVKKGQGGGAELARPPERITLDEIYRAVQRKPVFQIPLLEPGHPCRIGRQVGLVGGSWTTPIAPCEHG
jgi:DNA-binding IscR family transcriptional regulator